jgi:hypothetical protein
MSRREFFSHPLAVAKLPLFPGSFRGAALASTLGVLVLAQVSCLIPQTVEPIVEAPHPPPHFVVETIPNYLLAPVLTLTRQGSADVLPTPPCHCRLEFDGLSIGADPEIALEARWYIDYDTANPSSTRVWQTESMDPSFDDPTKTTRVLGTFPFDADGAGIVTSGVHIVEVVVGETAGFDRSTTAAQPNRSMKPGYTPAVYRFAVDVRLEQVPGQCPESPPSKRVCE